MSGSDEKDERLARGGNTDAQRAGVRKTVIIVVVFVLAVFAWTIFGRLIQ